MSQKQNQVRNAWKNYEARKISRISLLQATGVKVSSAEIDIIIKFFWYGSLAANCIEIKIKLVDY